MSFFGRLRCGFSRPPGHVAMQTYVARRVAGIVMNGPNPIGNDTRPPLVFHSRPRSRSSVVNPATATRRRAQRAPVARSLSCAIRCSSVRIAGNTAMPGMASLAAVSKISSICSGEAFGPTSLRRTWLLFANDCANPHPVNPSANHRAIRRTHGASVGAAERRLRDPEAEEPAPFLIDDNATTILLRGSNHPRAIRAELVQRELTRRLLCAALIRHDRSILPAPLTTGPLSVFRATKSIPWRSNVHGLR